MRSPSSASEATFSPRLSNATDEISNGFIATTIPSTSKTALSTERGGLPAAPVACSATSGTTTRRRARSNREDWTITT